MLALSAFQAENVRKGRFDMKLHSSRIDELCSDITNSGGNAYAPEIADKYSDVTIVYDTIVDQDISPFSDTYFNQQIELYEEISGRKLNQFEGELHPADTNALLMSPNPIGIVDANHVAEHVRALSAMLSVATLPGAPRILDMGAGHGVSSEIFAFCGCQVHAVDIDPVLGDISRKRAEVRNYTLTRSEMNFDDLSTIEENSYSAAFFFQSFHHCLKPWDLIAQLKSKLLNDGIIAFVGEPLQSTWWKNWGLRLDLESVYVARTHGWFESGWSHEFLSDCFAKSGMELILFSGGLAGSEIGIASESADKLNECRAKAASLGLEEIDRKSASISISPERYASLVGVPCRIFDRRGFCQKPGTQGVLLYGPYLDLQPGRYELVLLISCDAATAPTATGSSITIDVVSDLGSKVYLQETVDAVSITGAELIVRTLQLDEPVTGVEIRARIKGQCDWCVSLPSVRRLG